jgi:TPR repeat protein
VLYGNGRGVSQDLAQSYVWFTLSAARGNQDAAKNREFADRRLTAEQREQAQKIITAWRPKVTEVR